MGRVMELCEGYYSAGEEQAEIKGRDGASQLARILLEEATSINFFVGKAINPAHQNPEFPSNLSIKLRLVGELVQCLKNAGKQVNVRYF